MHTLCALDATHALDDPHILHALPIYYIALHPFHTIHVLPCLSALQCPSVEPIIDNVPVYEPAISYEQSVAVHECRSDTATTNVSTTCELQPGHIVDVDWYLPLSQGNTTHKTGVQ